MTENSNFLPNVWKKKRCRSQLIARIGEKKRFKVGTMNVHTRYTLPKINRQQQQQQHDRCGDGKA